MGTDTTNFSWRGCTRALVAILGIGSALASPGCFSETASSGSSSNVGDDDSGGAEATAGSSTATPQTDEGGSGGGTTGGPADTGADDTTTSGAIGTDGSTDDATGETGSESGSAVDTGNGGAPTFTPCDSPADCASGVCLLFVSSANQSNVVGGHCTEIDCQNPAADCPAPMGGSADPVCYQVSLDGDLVSVCALDCGGGAQCPAGLSCENDVIAPFPAACV